MSLAGIKLRIGVDLSPLERGLNKATSMVSKNTAKITRVADRMTATVGAGLAAIAAGALSSTSDLQGMQSALTTIAGSAEEARRQFALLRKDATNNPGLTMEPAVKGVVRLQAAGLEFEQSREAINEFANAMASVGNTDMDGVTLALSQIVAKGKVFAEEINQINERVPQIRGVLKDVLGTADTEKIQAMNLEVEEFVSMITEGFKRLPRAQQTINTGFRNLADSVKIASGEIGASIANTIRLQDVLFSANVKLNQFVEWWKGLSPAIQRAVLAFTATIAVIGPLVAIGTRLGAVLGFLTSPITLVVAGIAALAAGAVYLYNRFDSVRGVVHGLASAFHELGRIAKEVAAQYVNGFREITKGNFKKGFGMIADGFKRSNPIGLALFEGKRLAGSFKEGFQKGVEKDPLTVEDFFAQAGRGLGNLPTSVPMPDLTKPVGQGSSADAMTMDEIDQRISVPEIMEGKEGGAISIQTIAGGLERSAMAAKQFREAGLPNVFAKMQGSMEDWNAKLAETPVLMDAIKTNIVDGLAGAFDSLFSAIQSGAANAFESFVQSVKRAIAELAKLLIKTAIFAGLISLFGGGSFLSLFKGGLTGGIGGMLNPTKMAGGGLVTGPTPTISGEAGPELIIPLADLRKGGLGGGMDVTTRLMGEDLYLMIKRVTERMDRKIG